MSKTDGSSVLKKQISGLNQNVFLRKYAQIIYAIILILFIPLVIIGNSLFIVNRFTTNIEQHLQQRAVLIAELINVTLINEPADLANVQGQIPEIIAHTEEIISIDVLVPSENEFAIVASSNTSKIGKTIRTGNSFFTWYNGVPVAQFAPPTDAELLENPRLPNTSIWNVSAPVFDTRGEQIGLIDLRILPTDAEQLTNESLVSSYVFLGIAVAIVILLLLVNTRLFEYVVLFRKVEEVNKMKDEFISMASHELRTPITVISGYIEMFKDGSFGQLTGSGQKGIKIVEASAKRLADLIEDLLNVSRIEQGRLQIEITDVNANDVIVETVEEMKIHAEKKHLELTYEANEGLPHIKVDKDRFKQVLINLIGNAVKYTKQGSITIMTVAGDDELKVKVKDTGIGMAAKDREKLFSKFYRVKNEQTKGVTGTGLGLWITKQLVELMRGQIYVDSIEGQGTEVTLVFPIKHSR